MYPSMKELVTILLTILVLGWLMRVSPRDVPVAKDGCLTLRRKRSVRIFMGVGAVFSLTLVGWCLFEVVNNEAGWGLCLIPLAFAVIGAILPFGRVTVDRDAIIQVLPWRSSSMNLVDIDHIRLYEERGYLELGGRGTSMTIDTFYGGVEMLIDHLADLTGVIPEKR